MLQADMAELADAPDLGSGGRPCRFKSCYPQIIKTQGAMKRERKSSNCLETRPNMLQKKLKSVHGFVPTEHSRSSDS